MDPHHAEPAVAPALAGSPTSLDADGLPAELSMLASQLHRRLLDAPTRDHRAETIDAALGRLADETLPLLHARTRERLVAAVAGAPPDSVPWRNCSPTPPSMR